MKKVIALSLGIYCSLSFPLLAQITFQKSYSMAGNAFEYLYSVQQTNDDGYIIGGASYGVGAGGWDAYLINTDHFGNIRWTKHYGGIGMDVGYSVQQTTDGGYILAGYTNSFGEGNGDAYLVKTDTLGNVLWTKTYGGDSIEYCYSVQQTADGGYIIGGYTESFGMGSGDAYLIKTDAVGGTVWTKTYGGDSTDWAYSVQQTFDGGYIIAGTSYSYGAGNGDVYVIKVDSVGDTIWTRTFGGTNVENGYSVVQTSDGGYVVTGQTSSFGAGGFDVYMIKVNSAGTLLFANTYGNSDHDVGRSVRITNDGGYIVGGFSTSFGLGNLLPYVIKTDSSGDTEWTKVYNAGYCDQGISVEQTTDGGYIVATSTVLDQVFPSNIWPYLIKTDPSGNSGCSQLSANTITGSTSPLIGSGANVGSGGIVNGAATIVNDTIYIDSVLCYNLACNLSITNSIIDVNCNGGSDGSVNLTVTGGNSPYTFAWSNGDISEDVDSLNSGAYDITVTDFSGCMVTDSITITEPPTMVLTANTTPDTNNASIGMAWVTVSDGTPPYSYEWGGPIDVTTDTATGLISANYTITVTDSNGCVDSVEFTVGNFTGLETFNLGNNIRIFPNPNTGRFTLEMDLQEITRLNIKLYHFTGQLIHTEKIGNYTGNYVLQMDLTNYTKGIYNIQIATDTGITTRKIVYQ